MSDKSSGGGIGFGGVLTIVFVVLKLCKVIDWSWWWVLSPIWISIGIVVIIAIGFWIYCKVNGIDDHIDWRIKF